MEAAATKGRSRPPGDVDPANGSSFANVLGTIVFGWVFASHQIGAAVAAFAAGVIRDSTGEYTIAWVGAAAQCVVAAVISLGVRGRFDDEPRVSGPPLDAVHDIDQQHAPMSQ